jgi:hypothetical protein
MAHITINDLALDDTLDDREMSGRYGGLHLGGTSPATPGSLLDGPLSPSTDQVIVIKGEDKYGGWGGEW